MGKSGSNCEEENPISVTSLGVGEEGEQETGGHLKIRKKFFFETVLVWSIIFYAPTVVTEGPGMDIDNVMYQQVHIKYYDTNL